MIGYLVLLIFLLVYTPSSTSLIVSNNNNRIRAISFDVTGTLITTRQPVIQSYHDALLWSKFPNPPSIDEMKMAFKTAFKERCLESPCFGGSGHTPSDGLHRIEDGRYWWRETVKRVLLHSGRTTYSEEDFERYFRRVYQHFGSPMGYFVLDDAQAFLEKVHSSKKETDAGDAQSGLLLGITSNTPTRHMESILPMLGIHDQFHWFTCSEDVGYEKPSHQIFDATYQAAKYWIPDLQPHQILHVGDSFACDYCGAKAYGFQALLLDRRDNPNIIVYQDWIDAPDYIGKSEEDLACNTITNLHQVLDWLDSRQN